MGGWKKAREWFKRTETKLEHFMDAQNDEVVKYCLTLVDAKFIGETSNKVDKKSDQCEDNHEVNLGSLLQSMDYEIRERGDSFTGEEEKFLEFLEMVAILRRHHDVDPVRHRIKMLQDKNRFVELLKQRTEPSDALHKKHHRYWGTRQQLRFGKVVGDWIDMDYGPLDPIFGILLSPTGGRTGPGDSSVLHWMFFDNSGKFAYHSAVHDAFGYLKNYHHSGPGYKYLDAASMFKRDSPLSEQAAGIRFWGKALKHHTENALVSKTY